MHVRLISEDLLKQHSSAGTVLGVVAPGGGAGAPAAGVAGPSVAVAGSPWPLQVMNVLHCTALSWTLTYSILLLLLLLTHGR